MKFFVRLISQWEKCYSALIERDYFQQSPEKNILMYSAKQNWSASPTFWIKFIMYIATMIDTSNRKCFFTRKRNFDVFLNLILNYKNYFWENPQNVKISYWTFLKTNFDVKILFMNAFFDFKFKKIQLPQRRARDKRATKKASNSFQ